MSILQRRLAFTAKARTKCKRPEDLDHLWEQPSVSDTFRDYHEILLRVPGDTDTKIWIFTQLRNEADKTIKENAEISLFEIEVRKQMQQTITQIETAINARSSKAISTLTALWENCKEYLLRHVTLIAETEAKPSTLEWIYRRLLCDADTDNRTLIGLLAQGQLSSQQLAAREEVGNATKDMEEAIDSNPETSPATVYGDLSYESPAISRNRPFALIERTQQGTLLILGSFQQIWRNIGIFQRDFQLMIFEEDMIGLKCGTPFLGGKNSNLIFQFQEGVGLEIVVQQPGEGSKHAFQDIAKEVKEAVALMK